MRLINQTAIAIISVFLFSTPVFADFIGDYEASKWTAFTEHGGSIDATGAPYAIGLTSGDDGTWSPSFQDFTIGVVVDGLITFNWDFTTTDVDGPYWDPFGYLLNGNFFALTDAGGADSQYGMTSIEVMAGDHFGFRAYSRDSVYGSATTTITKFSGPAAVPEPGTILLLGTGLVALGAWLKRKQGQVEAQERYT